MKTLLSAMAIVLLCGAAAHSQDALNAAKLQELIKLADRNGDGKLDAIERAAASKLMEEFLRRHFTASADLNGDGKLDMSERAAAMQAAEKQRFDWMKTVASPATNKGQTVTPRAVRKTNGRKNSGSILRIGRGGYTGYS